MTDRNTQIILERIDRLEQRFMGLEKQIANLDSNLKAEIRDANTRIDSYQKSSSQIVNLALGFINGAVVVIVLVPVIKALTPSLVALFEKVIASIG